MGRLVDTLMGRFKDSTPPPDAPERPVDDSLKRGEGPWPVKLNVDVFSEGLPPVPDSAQARWTEDQSTLMIRIQKKTPAEPIRVAAEKSPSTSRIELVIGKARAPGAFPSSPNGSGFGRSTWGRVKGAVLSVMPAELARSVDELPKGLSSSRVGEAKVPAESRPASSPLFSSSSSALILGLSSAWVQLKDAFFSSKAVAYPVSTPKLAKANFLNERSSLSKPREGVRRLEPGQSLSQVQEEALVALSLAMTGRMHQTSVTQRTIGDYVKACLGLPFNHDVVSPKFADHADTLSRNASSRDFARQSVPRSAVQLLSALYIHQRGRSAFLEETGPQSEAGEQFIKFIATHAGLEAAEVKAAIKKDYLHDVKAVLANDGTVEVEIFGKRRPLEAFHHEKDAVLKTMRAELTEAVGLHLEAVRMYARMGKKPLGGAAADERARPQPIDSEGKGKGKAEDDYNRNAGRDIRIEPHLDDLEIGPVASASVPGAAASEVKAAPLREPALRWEHLEGITARVLWRIPSMVDLETYPSAELRKVLYELCDTDFHYMLRSLTPDQLAALATVAPASKPLAWDVENPGRKVEIDDHLRARADDLLGELATELNAIGAGQPPQGIGAVLERFASKKHLGWLASAFTGGSYSWIEHERKSPNSALKSLYQAIEGHAQNLPLDDAWRLLHVLDELAPLERDAAGSEDQKASRVLKQLGEARAGARNSLFARCVSVAKAETGNAVTFAVEVRSQEGHEPEFQAVAETLAKSRFSDDKKDEDNEDQDNRSSDTRVRISVTLGTGKFVENVQIPRNFFAEMGALLAGSPDALVIGGINIGALIGQRYRGRILDEVRAEGLDAVEQAGNAYRNDVRATELLLHTLASFCRSGAELTALTALLTQTSMNAANEYFKNMASRIVSGKEDDDVLETINVTSNKRIRVDRTGKGEIEVQPVFKVRFQGAETGKPNAQSQVFNAEYSRAAVLPTFLIFNEGKDTELAQIEHYSIFSRNEAPVEAEQLEQEVGEH